MKRNNLSKISVSSIVAIALASSSAHSATLIYEGFQYGDAADGTRPDNDSLQGQNNGNAGNVDATGLGGTWNDVQNSSSGELFMANGSLAFGDLYTQGNHVRSDTNQNSDIFVRTTTADLDSRPVMWFSFLANKLQNNFSAAEGGLVIGNQAVNNSRVFEDDGTGGLQGFGVAPTTSGNNWTAYAWNGTTQFDSGAVFSVPTNGSQTNLLVGRVSFNTGAGGLDEYDLYRYQLNAGSIVGGSLLSIGSTILVDVDETTLDTLSLTRQVNVAYDEIRVANSLGEVTPIPEPSTALLGAIGSFALLLRRRR